jgi:hypothetical protein
MVQSKRQWRRPEGFDSEMNRMKADNHLEWLFILFDLQMNQADLDGIGM